LTLELKHKKHTLFHLIAWLILIFILSNYAFFQTGDQPPPSLFLNKPTQGSTYEIPFGSFSYYGTHRILLYHVNPDYALLYEDQETSSQNFSTPISGINNGFGIFTGMSSDELLLEIKPE